MNQNVEHITPPRRFRPQSIVSNSTTSTHSNSTNYPVGLIKVYQSDEEFSTDSFSITSRKLNDARSIISHVGPSYAQNISTTSFSDTNDVDYETMSPLAGESLFDLWVDLSEAERDKLVIPVDGIERPKYVLDRIVQSFRSEKGAFLTDGVFLNHKIYQQSDVISNGSVKINIIQETIALLKKFEGDFHEVLKLNSLEQTLSYYKKLMEAFDVFESNGSPNTTSDALSTASSSNMPIQPYRTISKESAVSVKKSNSNTIEDKPKKRNSLLLDKFKGKIKHKKRHSLNNWDHHPQLEPVAPKTHSVDSRSHNRSISVSSTQTQGSSRSAKDQATIHEYLETIEVLQLTLNTIRTHEIVEHSEVQEKLSLVVGFLSQYIVKFVMSDGTSLSLKYIKTAVKELI